MFRGVSKWIWLPLILIASTAGAAPSRFDFAKAEWEEVSAPKADVQIYRWKAPDKDLFAFKGIALIDASIPKVVSVVTDITRQKEWLPDAGDVRLIEQVSPLHRIHYLHIRTPFVIKDRDFVIEGRATWKADVKELHLEFGSIKDPRVPPTDRVRGDIVRGYYVLKSADGGKKTLVTLQVYLDPKGTVPRWLVNATQKNYPKRMIEAIRGQAARSDVEEHPWARAALEGKVSGGNDLERWMKDAPKS